MCVLGGRGVRLGGGSDERDRIRDEIGTRDARGERQKRRRGMGVGMDGE